MPLQNYRLIRNYFFQAFIVALLACNLVFLYDVAYDQSFSIWYVPGLFLHTPVWFVLLMLADAFVKIRWDNRRLLIGSATMMAVLFLTVGLFDDTILQYLEPAFYAVDFLFGVSLLSFWRNRTV